MVHVEIEDFHASTAGGKVFVRHWHAFDCGARTPLILLHDSLGCVELWRDFPQQLAQRLQRPVLAYDRLGFGRSSRRTTIPGPDFIDEEAARDFPALRAALGIDRYVLFGHSVGGGMALAIAAFLRAPSLQALELGEETAAALGVAVGREKRIQLLLAVALTGLASSVAGPIGFVGHFPDVLVVRGELALAFARHFAVLLLHALRVDPG